MTGAGLDRLVPHAMMQTNESLYIGEFDLEPLQMSTQIPLPDMEALRLSRNHRMGSPPAQLHHLMPASHNSSAIMPTPPSHNIHEIHNIHDPLRLLPTSSSQQHQTGLLQVQQPQSPTHHTLTTMKYPGTPPDTPPCSNTSPSPPYQMTSVTTTGPTATIGLTDVTELVWQRYNQDQALDLRGQCDLGRGDKLGEGAWLNLEYVDTEDPNLRHCTTVISALPPTPTSSSLSGKVDVAGGSMIDDVQVGEVNINGFRPCKV